MSKNDHSKAQWWGGFEGFARSYPLPHVPQVALGWRAFEGFPIFRDGVALDRSTGQWPEDWVLRSNAGDLVMPGMFSPMPGWAKGVNPGTTHRWRKEVEATFRSNRRGGVWRW